MSLPPRLDPRHLHPQTSCAAQLEVHLAVCEDCRAACARAWLRFADTFLDPETSPPTPPWHARPFWRWSLALWSFLASVFFAFTLSAVSVLGAPGVSLGLSRVLSMGGGLPLLAVLLLAAPVTTIAAWRDRAQVAVGGTARRFAAVLASVAFVLLASANALSYITLPPATVDFAPVILATGVCLLLLATATAIACALHPAFDTPYTISASHALMLAILLFLSFVATQAKPILNCM